MGRMGAMGLALAMLTGAAAFGAQAAEKSAEDIAADRITAAENLKYVELSHEIDARNAAKKQAYEEALAAYEAALARHEADVAALEAAKVAAEQAYAKAKADWEAAVKACKAGDVSQCQH